MSKELHAGAVDSVLVQLVRQRGIDLRDYRRDAFGRGIAARLHATGCADVSAYLPLLDHRPDEIDRLVDALVVPVTAFFRDERVFDALERVVLPELRQVARVAPPLRTWCVGAATGEEAWSLAMLMAASGEGGELIASDIDMHTLHVGRRGLYPATALSPVPAPLRKRFFREDGATATVREELRERVRFARHDLMGRTLTPSQAVVASFHLVSCRNVLIYFDRRLQEKALERLLSVIEPGGALILGPAETMAGRFARTVTPHPALDPALRIFRVRGEH